MMSRESVDPDLSKNSKGNGGSTTKYPKFNSFSVNNRSDYFKQLTMALQIIQKVFNK